MRSQYGKLYQNIATKEFKCFSYNPAGDYYASVRTITEHGNRQSIFTSSVMLSLIEHFLLFHNASIVNIEFMEEDKELDTEIKNILSMMKTNGAYWSVLKEKLAFLSRYDSVDIKRVEMKVTNGAGYLVSMQVNGIVAVTENAYDTATNEIVKVLGRVLA